MSERLVRCRVCRSVYVAQRGCDECADRQRQDEAERAERAKWNNALDPGPRRGSPDEERERFEELEAERHAMARFGGDR